MRHVFLDNDAEALAAALDESVVIRFGSRPIVVLGDERTEGQYGRVVRVILDFIV